MKPKPGDDGKYPVDRAAAASGEKLLRTIMADNKIELYGTYVCYFTPYQFASSHTKHTEKLAFMTCAMIIEHSSLNLFLERER